MKTKVIAKFSVEVVSFSKSRKTATLFLRNREGEMLTVEADTVDLPKGIRVGERMLLNILKRTDGWTKAVYEVQRLDLTPKQWAKYLREVKERDSGRPKKTILKLESEENQRVFAQLRKKMGKPAQPGDELFTKSEQTR